jgi:hypothetical protein
VLPVDVIGSPEATRTEDVVETGLALEVGAILWLATLGADDGFLTLVVHVVLLDQLALVLPAHKAPWPSDCSQWYHPVVCLLDVEVERGRDRISLAAAALKWFDKLAASLNHWLNIEIRRLEVRWPLCLCYLFWHIRRRGVAGYCFLSDDGSCPCILLHPRAIFKIRVIYTFFLFLGLLALGT